MSPSNHYWWRYEVGQWLVFGWFGGWGTLDTQLARRKLGKKKHPNHGCRHCPMATMVPSSQHRHVQQLADMLRDKSMLLKLENMIVFTIYYLFSGTTHCWRIVNAPCLSVCGLGQQVALRVSYSQWAALRVLCSQCALRVWILSAPALRASYYQHHPLRVWYSQRCLVVLLHYAMYQRRLQKTTTIGNTDKCQLRTLVNSISTAPPIGLPPKGAKFCHTLNTLLVEPWCRHALLWLYFIPLQAVGWLVRQLVGDPK